MRTTITLYSILMLVVHTNLYGESSAERKRLTDVSWEQGLNARKVPLLEVIPPEGGRNRRLEVLREVLAKGSDPRIQISNPGRLSVRDHSSVLFAKDNSWYLEVMGDGSRFRYHGNIEGPAKQGTVEASRKLDLATLERLGREFITKRLFQLIPPIEGERLLFLGSRYLRDGSATESTPFTSEVKANMAVFGREVRGVFVAGPGSKITVWFSNDGEPVAFFADWPQYRVSDQTQATLDISDIKNRLKNYADKPFELIQRNLKHFECGYVDLGVFRRSMGLIQTGCLAVHSGQIQEFEYGAIEAIPIGVTVVSDAQWPVTRSVASHSRWNACSISSVACKEPQPAAGGPPAEQKNRAPRSHGVHDDLGEPITFRMLALLYHLVCNF
jgi:hypothetical protein